MWPSELYVVTNSTTRWQPKTDMRNAYALVGSIVDITGMPGGIEGNRDILQDFRLFGRVLNPAPPNRKHEC